MLDSLVTALLSAPATVVPSGFTRRACGVVTAVLETPVGISLSPFSAPLSSTTLASYHLPSFAFTKRLPWSSVYTTVPASPLRSAFTLDVKSLPFKPSAPVGPFAPMPASVPVAVPDLPSRPSDAVLPNFANWSFTSLCNPIVIVSPFAVVTISLAAVSPCTFSTPVDNANPTLLVSKLFASFVTLPAKFNVALPATVLLIRLIASSTYFLFVTSVLLAASKVVVNLAPPKSTILGTAGLVPSFDLPGVTVIVVSPFLIVNGSVPLPEIPFISVNVSAK